MRDEVETLRDYVLSRLYADDHRHDHLDQWLKTAAPEDVAAWLAKFGLDVAKVRARQGDPGSLRKILTEMTGDPGIAEFITTPPTPRRHSRTRLDYERARPFKQFAHDNHVVVVKQICKIITEREGTSRGISATVVEVAADILRCSPEKIREILKRG